MLFFSATCALDPSATSDCWAAFLLLYFDYGSVWNHFPDFIYFSICNRNTPSSPIHISV